MTELRKSPFYHLHDNNHFRKEFSKNIVGHTVFAQCQSLTQVTYVLPRENFVFTREKSGSEYLNHHSITDRHLTLLPCDIRRT